MRLVRPSSPRLLAAVGFGVVLLPFAAIAACGSGGDAPSGTPRGAEAGSDDEAGDDELGEGGGADGEPPVSDATLDGTLLLDAGFTNGDPPQSFDGGPYLVFYGQEPLGDSGAATVAGFHLYDEATLVAAGDFLVAPVASAVLGVTRDPGGSNWWTSARIADQSIAAAAYAVTTGSLSYGPIVLAPADAGVTSPAFVVGGEGTMYIGGGRTAPGLLSAVSSTGVATPIALPAASAAANCVAYDSTVGLVAGTSSFVLAGAAAAPYVLVVPPGASTATVAPKTWSATFPETHGGSESEAGPGDGGVDFAGITALTLAPGGHVVYAIVSTGLAVIDLTASTGTVLSPPSGILPSSSAIPVITGDGAHVVFTGETKSLDRTVLVFDTASSTFTSIAPEASFSFATDLAIAGDGARVYGVELADLVGGTSRIVRIDPVAGSIAQTAPLLLDEEATQIHAFFSAQ